MVWRGSEALSWQLTTQRIEDLPSKWLKVVQSFTGAEHSILTACRREGASRAWFELESTSGSPPVIQENLMKKYLILFVGAGMIGCASAPKARLVEVSERPHGQRFLVAVLDFENRTGDAGKDHFAKAAAGSLMDELQKYGRFRFIERQKIESIEGELKHQYSGLVNEADAKTLGRQLGADAVLIGSLDAVTSDRKKRTLIILSKEDRRTEAVLSGRLVMVESAEVLAASKAVGVAVEKKRMAFWIARLGNIGDGDAAVQVAMDMALQQLANDIAARTPAK
jgi:TolB-like protein